MNEPFIAGSLKEFIDLGQDDELTHYNFSIIELLDDNLEIPISNIIENDYLEEMRILSETVVLSDKEFRLYKYKPHLLSLVLYGTPELYFVILAINDMVSKKEFNEKEIKLVPKNNMLQIMNYIYNAEKEYIDDNRVDLNEKKNEV